MPRRADKRRATPSASEFSEERRTLVSEIAVLVLLGVAFEEMAPIVGDAIRHDGPTVAHTSAFLVFFLTSLRFAIGNFLHLVGNTRLTWGYWSYDFVAIAFESVLLILLGGTASLEASEGSSVTFTELLVFLLSVDIVWLLTQYVFGSVGARARKGPVFWDWAVINLGVIATVVLLDTVFKEGTESSEGYGVLAIANVVAFVLDMWRIKKRGLVPW